MVSTRPANARFSLTTDRMRMVEPRAPSCSQDDKWKTSAHRYFGGFARNTKKTKTQLIDTLENTRREVVLGIHELKGI